MTNELSATEATAWKQYAGDGILTEQILSGMGRISDGMSDRVDKIFDLKQDIEHATSRANGYTYHLETYGVDNFSITAEDIEIRSSYYDRCDGTSYRESWISFDDFLDPSIIDRLTTELAEIKHSAEGKRIKRELQCAADKIKKERDEFERLQKKFGK